MRRRPPDARRISACLPCGCAPTPQGEPRTEIIFSRHTSQERDSTSVLCGAARTWPRYRQGYDLSTLLPAARRSQSHWPSATLGIARAINAGRLHPTRGWRTRGSSLPRPSRRDQHAVGVASSWSTPCRSHLRHGSAIRCTGRAATSPCARPGRAPTGAPLPSDGSLAARSCAAPPCSCVACVPAMAMARADGNEGTERGPGCTRATSTP